MTVASVSSTASRNPGILLIETTPSECEIVQNLPGRFTLDEWQRIFDQRDRERLPDLLADNVTYHGPADAMPLRGRMALAESLRLSFEFFENFEYARQFGGDEDHRLEFRGRVGDAAFTGNDIIR
ncbi:MAG: hypothetical protein V2I43_05025 [Parvularcula sp.]|nr:hypothetical protein [Parvularcula sp.]